MIGTLKELYEETVESQIRVWDDEIEQLGAERRIPFWPGLKVDITTVLGVCATRKSR